MSCDGVSMTGEQASTGRQVKAGVDLYMNEHGNKVAGKTIKSSSAIPAAYPTTPSGWRRN